jgi:pyruvate-formate lyase-activating enzyme
MDYKRLEIYVWWTCNHNCTYCMEMPNMKEAWNKKVTKYDILKKLIKYKKLWYNHVTYLWWEPFLQSVFLDALKLWKKFGYTILVATNATTLYLEGESKKYLPYIDQLFLSVQAIDEKLQQKISRTSVLVKWKNVFKNIRKYWNWNFMKCNIVITQDNKNNILDIVRYLNDEWIKEISITYPDIEISYWIDFILKRIAPTYSEAFKYIPKILDFCILNDIKLKIPDFPFCIFPKKNIEKYIGITDDFDYWMRIKITHEWKILDRWNVKDEDDLPRERFCITKCIDCKYKWKCWWPSIHYNKLYWYSEINPIKNEK